MTGRNTLNKMSKDKTGYNDYDGFAWIYNRHWGTSFLPVIMPILENRILRHLPRHARLLDLCCGTGQLAQMLSRLGYPVTGIDGSPEMLTFARQNAPGVEFIAADARDFDFPEQFSAVVAAFDSLNHVMKLKELEKVFANTFRALQPGGKFIFDLNTTEGFDQEWQGEYNIDEKDHGCFVEQKYYAASRVAVYDVAMWKITRGKRRQSRVRLRQKNHDPQRVRGALKKVGFVNISVNGFDWETGLGPLTAASRRVFFICRKPKNT